MVTMATMTSPGGHALSGLNQRRALSNFTHENITLGRLYDDIIYPGETQTYDSTKFCRKRLIDR